MTKPLAGKHVAVLLGGCVASGPAAVTAPVMYRSLASAGASVDQREAADLFNGHRRLKGLAAMAPDPTLARIAAAAARELAELNQPDAVVAAHIRAELKQAAIARGMSTLRMSGIKKILAGVTTPEEILRVTMSD